MDYIEYLPFINKKNYLSNLPNEVLMLIYDYIDINLNDLIKCINDMDTKFSNEEIFNYFYKWDSHWVNNKNLMSSPNFDIIYINNKLKLSPKYNSEYIYKIPFNYWTINSTLDNIKIIPLFYRPIEKLTKKYDGITIFEKHHLEDIFGYHGYINSYNHKFKYNKLKNNCNYTCRESVLLSFLFYRTKYIFNGVELKFFSTRKNKITKKELLHHGFIQINH